MPTSKPGARSTHSILVLIILLFASPPLFADELGNVSNRLAIAEMLAQYSYRWDSKDSQAFAELFTENGSMERWLNGAPVAGSRVEGRQAIFDYAKQSHEGRLADRQTRHHFSGLVFLELSNDSAVTENMALITHQTATDPAAVIRSSGIYRNSWKKTADGWRIQHRILFTDSFQP
jgi:uncharacterized protein (TIGR02246 family)